MTTQTMASGSSEAAISNIEAEEARTGLNLTEVYQKRMAEDLGDRTALDRHTERNLADDTIEELKEKIERSGVKYIYYQLPTLHSRTVAKMVPAKHIVRNLERGVSFQRSALMDMQNDIFGNLIGGIDTKEFVSLPNPETFEQLPWDHEVGRMFCSAYEPNHLPEIGGQLQALDSRGNLHRTHQVIKDIFGLTLKSGTEPEMTWEGESIEPNVVPGFSPSYQVANLESMRPIYMRVHEYATALGFDMIESDYEDPGQIELNWNFDDVELTADRLVTYRQICAQVAGEFGVEASFMPKPRLGEMGNGCHHNISLWDGEDNNALIIEGKEELHMSQLGQWAIGGILKHAPGMMLIMASTVNSYKRFWDPGQFAPVLADWGLDNRGTMIRVSSNGRAEVRVPDAAVNPYLSHALLLTSIADGIGNRIEPPAMNSGGVELPRTLGEAIEAYKADDYIQQSLPADLATMYAVLKEDEWARYCGIITDWERRQYWRAIP